MEQKSLPGSSQLKIIDEETSYLDRFSETLLEKSKYPFVETGNSRKSFSPIKIKLINNKPLPFNHLNLPLSTHENTAE